VWRGVTAGTHGRCAANGTRRMCREDVRRVAFGEQLLNDFGPQLRVVMALLCGARTVGAPEEDMGHRESVGSTGTRIRRRRDRPRHRPRRCLPFVQRMAVMDDLDTARPDRRPRRVLDLHRPCSVSATRTSSTGAASSERSSVPSSWWPSAPAVSQDRQTRRRSEPGRRSRARDNTSAWGTLLTTPAGSTRPRRPS